MAKLYDEIFILFTQNDKETGKQTVFMTYEGYKEMNDWRHGSPD